MTEEWLTPERSETEAQRLNRHWNELLQELRVVQTGVQVLTGFLLTVPFQARFVELDHFQRAVYLSSVLLSVLSTGLLIAPVALHRWLFRAGARPLMLGQAQRLAVAGILLLGLSLAAVLWLVFDVVLGRGWGYAMGGGLLAVLFLLWAAIPLAARRAVRRTLLARPQRLDP
ncbi:MAG: DUF6328 family protein [Sporichthyaceae bacterium]